MSDLKACSQKVVALKKKLLAYRNELHTTRTRQRYEELLVAVNITINEIYDAVGDLCDVLTEITGIEAGDFPDLLRDHGYVGGKQCGAPLPKRIREARGEPDSFVLSEPTTGDHGHA